MPVEQQQVILTN